VHAVAATLPEHAPRGALAVAAVVFTVVALFPEDLLGHTVAAIRGTHATETALAIAAVILPVVALLPCIANAVATPLSLRAARAVARDSARATLSRLAAARAVVAPGSTSARTPIAGLCTCSPSRCSFS
jgi:hypothetical protein